MNSKKKSLEYLFTLRTIGVSGVLPVSLLKISRYDDSKFDNTSCAISTVISPDNTIVFNDSINVLPIVVRRYNSITID